MFFFSFSQNTFVLHIFANILVGFTYVNISAILFQVKHNVQKVEICIAVRRPLDQFQQEIQNVPEVFSNFPITLIILKWASLLGHSVAKSLNPIRRKAHPSLLCEFSHEYIKFEKFEMKIISLIIDIILLPGLLRRRLHHLPHNRRLRCRHLSAEKA